MSSDHRRAGIAAAGFSLVEVMIVIVIIGMLAGLVAVNVRGSLTKARQNAARKDISVIVETLDMFWAEFHRYPTNDEGLTILAQPSDPSAEPLLKDVPLDPWKRPYIYNAPGREGPFEVLCLGADQKEGGTGAAADISSDSLRRVQQ